jgi:uncharacterized protein (TIGR03083 family)
LCAGWDVKTVAAHLVGVFADSFWTFLRAALRHGGFHRAIDELARRRARSPAAEIARTLRQCADHRLNPPVTGPLSGLTDVLVHGGDIQIPLGIAFRPDDDQVGWALDFLTGPGRSGSSRAAAYVELRFTAQILAGRGVPEPRFADQLHS